MGKLAKRRLGNMQRLARALAQQIPFASESFDSILSTFPTVYIFDKQTLSEAHRVLRNSGRLIILLAAWPKNPLLAWLFKVTGESPPESLESKIKSAFAHTEFNLEVKIVNIKSSSLLILNAIKEASK